MRTAGRERGEHDHRNLLRVASTAGIAAGVSTIVGAAALKPGFRWNRDTLSSLAEDKKFGKMFTGGALVAAPATALLAKVVRDKHPGCAVATVSEAALLATAAGLAGTGVTHGKLGRWHGKFAITFWAASSSAVILDSLDIMMHGSKGVGIVMLATGIASAATTIKRGIEEGRIPADYEAAHAVLVCMGGAIAGMARLMPVNAVAND